MFPREFLSKLEQWADSEDRKPLAVHKYLEWMMEEIEHFPAVGHE
jgi:hypothetical protein